MADGKVTYKVDVDDSGVNKQLDKVNSDIEKKAKTTGGNSGKIAAGAALAIGAAATTAIIGIGKQALTAYAEYEQLVGGVETLFKESSDTVQKYAEDAYKTAGISANEYMSTVTSFSASLLQSLGGDTAKAAAYADQAIIDMSDNANKMGTDMGAIQFAYQGFAKQNFTMLDNLKLGYGGTKTEMERLLADAGKISGVEFDISSYADITQAIHIMQEEMGIAGTTAKEATETIAGSLASTKSAFANLVAGLGNSDADIKKLISNVVESVGNVVKNVMPIVSNIVSALPQFIGMIVDMLPELFNALLPAILELLPDFVNAIILGLASALTALIDMLPQIIDTVIAVLLNSIPILINTGIALFISLIQALPEIINQIVSQLPIIINSIIDALLDNLPLFIQAGVDLFLALVQAMPFIITTIISMIPEIIGKLLTALKDNFPLFIQAGKDMFLGIASGIGKAVSSVVKSALEAAGKVLNSVLEFFGIASPSKVFEYVGRMNMKGIQGGFEDEEVNVIRRVTTVMNKVTAASAKALDVSGSTNNQNIIVNTDTSKASNTGQFLNDQTALLRQQNELLRQILDKTGLKLDGKDLSRSVDTYKKSLGATILGNG